MNQFQSRRVSKTERGVAATVIFKILGTRAARGLLASVPGYAFFDHMLFGVWDEIKSAYLELDVETLRNAKLAKFNVRNEPPLTKERAAKVVPNPVALSSFFAEASDEAVTAAISLASELSRRLPSNIDVVDQNDPELEAEVNRLRKQLAKWDPAESPKILQGVTVGDPNFGEYIKKMHHIAKWLLDETHLRRSKFYEDCVFDTNCILDFIDPANYGSSSSTFPETFDHPGFSFFLYRNLFGKRFVTHFHAEELKNFLLNALESLAKNSLMLEGEYALRSVDRIGRLFNDKLLAPEVIRLPDPSPGLVRRFEDELHHNAPGRSEKSVSVDALALAAMSEHQLNRLEQLDTPIRFVSRDRALVDVAQFKYFRSARERVVLVPPYGAAWSVWRRRRTEAADLERFEVLANSFVEMSAVATNPEAGLSSPELYSPKLLVEFFQLIKPFHLSVVETLDLESERQSSLIDAWLKDLNEGVEPFLSRVRQTTDPLAAFDS